MPDNDDNTVKSEGVLKVINTQDAQVETASTNRSAPSKLETLELRRVARSYNSSIIQKDMHLMLLPDATGKFPKEFPSNGHEFARLSGNPFSIIVAAEPLPF